MDDLAEELHKPVIRKFRKRRVLVHGIDKIWAADLADMSNFSESNEGVKYLLAVIDIFSKYGWLVPLKNKFGKSVAEALKVIFKERKPKKLWTDKGTEFYNKNVKEIIELYSTQNEEKSSVVERWIRTMKEKIWKYFTAKNTTFYLDALDDLVKKYNNTIHSSTKMTPVDASKEENKYEVMINLYPFRSEVYKESKFSVGDRVRITKKKSIFEKGYTTKWREEIFVVSEVKNTTPVTYKIKDHRGLVLRGSFYERELQKTKHTEDDFYRIEKVIRKEKDRSLVKWKGYSDEFNTWIDNKLITDI